MAPLTARGLLIDEADFQGDLASLLLFDGKSSSFYWLVFITLGTTNPIEFSIPSLTRLISDCEWFLRLMAIEDFLLTPFVFLMKVFSY